MNLWILFTGGNSAAQATQSCSASWRRFVWTVCEKSGRLLADSEAQEGVASSRTRKRRKESPPRGLGSAGRSRLLADSEAQEGVALEPLSLSPRYPEMTVDSPGRPSISLVSFNGIRTSRLFRSIAPAWVPISTLEFMEWTRHAEHQLRTVLVGKLTIDGPGHCYYISRTEHLSWLIPHSPVQRIARHCANSPAC